MKKVKKKFLIVCSIILLLVTAQPISVYADESEDVTAEQDKWPDSPSIMGESGILMEVSTGTILYEKNIHAIQYPASITKIMTALLAIENCRLDETVVVPAEAVYMEDKGTHIALDEGEQLSVEQCLYAVLLASANDAAYALAEHVGGTYENFIEMMNEKARELGCQNTNFTNPHGLPDENHVTTAYDMALITKAALQYDEFRKIAGTSYYEIPPSEYQKDLICMYNHHKMIGQNEFYNEEVFAGKNGYTTVAKNTLVTCARRDDMEVICVMMNTEGKQVYLDTQELLNYGLDNFKKVSIADDRERYEKLLNEKNYKVSDTDSSDAYMVIPKEINFSDLVLDLDASENHDTVSINYFFEDHFVGKAEFPLAEMGSAQETAQNQEDGAEKNTDNSKIKIIIISIIICVLIVGIGVVIKILFTVRKRKLKRRRRRKKYRFEIPKSRRRD